MVSVSVLMLAGMATAFGTAPGTVTYQGEFSERVEQVATPTTERIDSNSEKLVRETRIQRGDTVSGLLSRMGVRDEGLLAFLYANSSAGTMFRQLVPGKTLTAQVGPNGSLHSLVFPLNGDKDTALVIQQANNNFAARIQDIPFETRIVSQSASIRHSLFGAADEAGIPDDVALGLVEIFGGEIDFHRDLRKGDSFSVIYEVMDFQGKPVRSKRILAAEFVNDGKQHHAFWYQDNSGTSGYYSAEGQSLKKAFLRSPLEFSRVTSGFSNSRYHPVLREMRAHRGIDYGAPTGTRVKATGDGVVDFAGVQGGYGKVVFIRHPGNKVTVYGHLSGFSQGIRKGTRVSQGDTIGFVGATGMATGPHLHYEFRVAGVHRNPLTVTLPQSAPLSPPLIASFRTHAENMMAQIASIRNWQLVMLD